MYLRHQILSIIWRLSPLNPQIAIDDAEEKRWLNWGMQDGYKYNYGEHDSKEGHADEDLPRRGKSPGLHMGLTVLMDVQEEEYYCSGTESVGFKVTPQTLLIALLILSRRPC